LWQKSSLAQPQPKAKAEHRFSASGSKADCKLVVQTTTSRGKQENALPNTPKCANISRKQNSSIRSDKFHVKTLNAFQDYLINCSR
jgi:hypothetical protein